MLHDRGLRRTAELTGNGHFAAGGAEQVLQRADVGPAIAQALDRLTMDPQERQRLGRNGRRAVLEKYNWEAEFQKLLKMYTTLQDEIR